MIAFHFGSPERRLFAAFHAPSDLTSQSANQAVLLCPPLGQEAVRLHRFYKVLADRLARAGVPTLRFDYFGTGESMGDDLDSHLSGWQADIEQAHRELAQRTRAGRITWIGARLGASAALVAAQREPSALAQLVLWEPILDGSAYLRQLAQDHAHSITRIGQPTPVVEHRPAGEALGFGLSSLMLDEIAALRPDLLQRVAPTIRTIVLSDAPLSEAPASVTHRALQVPFDWTSEEALNTSLVPPAALKALTDLVQEARA
ncbi:MAG: alpha/beta hydrolase [Burkholderiales bacterium]|nr:alpha/beta hydrolase [Burkholderiales bacterium]